MLKINTLLLLLFVNMPLLAATPKDFAEIKTSVMQGFSADRLQNIKKFLGTNKVSFQKKNTSLYNKAIKLVEDITKLANQKEYNFKRIEALMKELFDAIRGLDGKLDTLKDLFPPPVIKDKDMYFGCEKSYQWIQNKKLGQGIGGSVYIACNIRTGGKDCNYVAKLSPSTLNSSVEKEILEVLKNQDITPKVKETYECQMQEPNNPTLKNMSVIVMDKFEGTLENIFDKYLADAIVKKYGSIQTFRDGIIKRIVAAIPDNKKYTKETLVTAPLSTLNLLAFLLGDQLEFKHIKLDAVSENIKNILEKLDTLITKLNKNKILHRDLKFDNIVYRRGEKGDPKLALIDFGQSLELKDAEHARAVSTYWSANRFVRHIPTFFAESVVDCYDKVTLEMELLEKYGIDYSFKDGKECRKRVNDDYVSNHFRKLLTKNGYNLPKFEKERKGEENLEPEEIESEPSNKGADMYYKELSEDELKY